MVYLFICSLLFLLFFWLLLKSFIFYPSIQFILNLFILFQELRLYFLLFKFFLHKLDNHCVCKLMHFLDLELL